MLSACLLFIYGVDRFFRRLFGSEKSRFTTWRRTPSQRRPHLGAETVVARPRCGRRWEQMRARHVPDSPKGMGIGLGGWGGGREMRSLKGRGLKIGILKVGGSALAAEICTGPHNRLLRRQHCSSLCSQSEGSGHVAKMLKSAIGSPLSSSPSLCEQSELQCFAPIQFVPHTRLARRKHKMTFRKHFCPPKSAGDKGFALCLLRNLFSMNVYGLTYWTHPPCS